MAVEERFILPADVVIAAVAELPREVRDGFSHEDGDCAISRPLARARSTVVDQRAADLLERFREPATIVEAVVAYSAAEGLDPRTTLDESFPMLSGLVADGLLVAASSKLAVPIATSLEPGDRCAGFELLEPVHVIVDTEVFLARSPDGELAALKIARPGSERALAPLLRREAEALSHLDGKATPRLLAAGVEGDRPFLALEWCEGVDVLQAATSTQALPAPHAQKALLELAEDVIAAYVHLHGQGIAHGDVHPRNALAGREREVKLIDFGLAAPPAAVGAAASAPRGGVDFFLEPESAAAQLAGEPPPALSLAGEQYSLASLVYLLLTGGHTHDFSLEPEEMLRQLRDEGPLPFSRHGAEMPAVERVVARALAHDPVDRYPSTVAFLAAFREAAAEELREQPRHAARPPGQASSELLDDVVSRIGAPQGELFEAGLEAPTASAMNGAAGLAYALLRIAAVREDEALLAAADLWAVRAHLELGTHEAFWNEELEIVPEIFGENSFFHHGAGVEFVRALLARESGDRLGMKLGLDGFLAAAEAPCEQRDVAFGKAGMLLGAGQMLALAPAEEREGIRRTGDALARSLWEELEAEPALGEGPGSPSLGAAHGWAGCLYALLHWSGATGEPPPAGLRARLEELAAAALPVGRGLRWPYEAGSPMPHTGLEASWCNGAAGHVFLWAAAEEAFAGAGFGEVAAKAAWTAFESPVPSVGDLCCGFAGRAYALLRQFRLSGDEVWAVRAGALAERAAREIRSHALRRDSLYKGEIAVALLAAELESPEQARMPLFE